MTQADVTQAEEPWLSAADLRVIEELRALTEVGLADPHLWEGDQA